MSLTSLDYDKFTYKHNLAQSIGPGEYWTQTPMPHCRECFANDPRLRLAKSGNSKCVDVPLIDVDSELLGITRKASNCPFDKYLPVKQEFCKKKNMPKCRDEQMMTEDTRLSNPPCTLRGIENGFNRWEWLCQNPQERVEMPFDVQIDTKTMFKDNHRPCIPTPINQAHALPPHNSDDSMMRGTMPCVPNQFNHPMANAPLGSTHWKQCSGILPSR
jgi:hypothetical protein